SGRDVHACSPALSTPRRAPTTVSRLAWLAPVSSRACRVADGAYPGRAAPHPGTASPRPCHDRGGACWLGEDIVPPGCDSRCTDTLRAGDSPIRSHAAPHFCVPAWAGCWCGVPQLCCLDAVDTWLSEPGVRKEPRGSDTGTAGCAPF